MFFVLFKKNLFRPSDQCYSASHLASKLSLLFLTSRLAASQFLFVFGKKYLFSFTALAQLVYCLPAFRNDLLHYYFMCIGLATIVTTTVAYIAFLYFTDKNSLQHPQLKYPPTAHSIYLLSCIFFMGGKNPF